MAILNGISRQARHGFESAWSQVPRSTDYRLKRLGRLALNLNHYVQYRLQGEVSAEARTYADQIRRDGFVVLHNQFTADEIAGMRDVLTRAVTEERVVPINKVLFPKGSKEKKQVRTFDWNTVDLAIKDPLRMSRHFVEFAAHPLILQITNAYFGMAAALHQSHVWRNPPNELAPMGSFLWHRDPEGPYLLKSFLYLNDVDDETTHFTFIRHSHAGEHIGWRTKYRLSDDEMRALIPEDRWVNLVGPAGTLILADTNGFHRGTKGTRTRRMATSVYTVYPHSSRTEVAAPFVQGLSPMQRLALRFCHIS
jgi:hypothetical protein